MGRINSESEEHASSHSSHFSHPHPLHLIPSHQTPNLQNLGCAGCKLKPSGMIYSCTVVSTFFLHKNCFEMPTRITHPFHKDHAFTLLPKPAYAGGKFNCDACSETGDGFSYHCKPCGIDLHILCAAAPLSLTSAYHAHKLELAFGSPYESKNFACDVCSGPGSDHWLYRCNACGFDAHLKCARATPPPPPPLRPVPPMMSSAAVGVPAFGVNAQNDMAYQQAIVQMIQNNNAMVRAIPAGGGGVDRGSQQQMQMMQLMSLLNRGTGGLGGGLDILGGGGIDSLQSLLGGGGLDSLQSLLGGGGLDFLGGGGLDFLGGLGGL